ncbi:unnamed protein product [Paramecium pentaurelia]|uniref:Uncharacterized protein n=1 Tax=Paramecium pentaurelia TaxID=43138 RepID=A0A8S1VMG1_9CILI|nr:unnamed protein product [Paramecium pentaurelia]
MVSVSIFSSNAQMSINCEFVNLNQMDYGIKFEKGGSNFAQTYQKDYNLIIQQQNDKFQNLNLIQHTLN